MGKQQFAVLRVLLAELICVVHRDELHKLGCNAQERAKRRKRNVPVLSDVAGPREDCRGIGARAHRRSRRGNNSAPHPGRNTAATISGHQQYRRPQCEPAASSRSRMHDGRGDEGQDRRHNILYHWAHEQQPAVRAVPDGVRHCKGCDKLRDGVYEWLSGRACVCVRPYMASEPDADVRVLSVPSIHTSPDGPR